MTSQIIPLPLILLYLESVEREKLQNFEYLENEKSFFEEIKNIFQFWQGYHLVEKQQFHKK